MHKCRTCLLEKELTDFHKNLSYATGHATRCKVCANAWSKEHRETHPAKLRAKKYGIDEITMSKMLEIKHCALCGESHSKMVIDHCHTTGKVRGVLCDPCNVGLGHFRDDIERLKNAINYLEMTSG